MLRIYNQFAGLPIISFRTSGQVGVLSSLIIQPENFRIAGVFVESRRYNEMRVLLTDDIRSISQIGVVVDDEEVIVEVDDLVRLKKTIEIEYKVIGKKVLTEKQRSLGKVTDFAIDDDSWNIQKIYVNKGVVRNFKSFGKIIDRSQIKEVTDSKIIVKEAEEKITEKVFATASPPA